MVASVLGVLVMSKLWDYFHINQTNLNLDNMDLDHQVIEFWNYIKETHLNDRNVLLCIVSW